MDPSILAACMVALQAPAGVPREAPAAVELEAPERLKSADTFIDMGKQIAHAGPSMFDFDGDGKRDLIVGNFRGTLALYRNAGSAAEPEWEGKGFLEAEGKEVQIHNW